MGVSCYSAPLTELDQHIDKYHTHRRAPMQQPYFSQTNFTSAEDALSKQAYESPQSVGAFNDL